MTDILCRWLNEEVKFSKKIELKSFQHDFASGYFIGEILHKHGLQDDFSSFSRSSSAESKLSNFTKIEPTMSLLGIPFDTKVAKDIMDEKPGVATRLIYQLFIALGQKSKRNLTGVAMETMRPSGPAKLSEIETDLYRERLKCLVPRQVDLNFENLVKKYHGWQKDQEEKAFQAKLEEEEKLRKYQQRTREQGLQRSKDIREKQEETMQKIREATVKIPKPIATKKSGKQRSTILNEKAQQSVIESISNFENSLKAMPPPMSPLDMDRSAVDTDIEIFLNSSAPAVDITFGKPALGDDYVAKIRRRLEEDAKARKEREKRRRRVLVEQLKSHEAQEEAHREEMLVNRLMRQSQMERRIAVQLMHARHEKEIIKKDRMLREKQFSERRLKDFVDALDREAEMCRQARVDYEREIQHNTELHQAIVAEKAQQKYEKHYNLCKDILLNMVDFTCKVGEYRELTEKHLPPKLVREWKALFVEGKPLYLPLTDVETSPTPEIDAVKEEKELLLDEEDFTEYREFTGEWELTRGTEVLEKPKENVVLGHILHRIFAIVSPPEPPPPPPEFPPCPLKISVVGKFFSGKSSAIEQVVETRRIISINVDILVEDALEAFKRKESVTIDTEVDESKAQEPEIVEDNIEKHIEKEINETEQDAEASPNKTLSEDGKSNEGKELSPLQESSPDTNKNGGDVKKQEKPPEMNKTFGAATSALIFTKRAKLGSKAFAVLKKGKQMPDSLLIDIILERIRNIPDGTGWILDGFPATINQAKLLEKALTGNDVIPVGPKSSYKDVAKKAKKPKLVSDPHPPSETSSIKSGLDLVCLFDIADDVILRRAEGRTYDPTTATDYHQEFDPPPEGSYTGHQTQAKVLPVADPSNDREQVQTRLAGFQDTLPKLEKWYGKYGILKKIDASRTRGELVEDLQNVIEETFQKLNAPPPEEKPMEQKDPPEQEQIPVEEPKPEVPSEPITETPPSPEPEAKAAKAGTKGGKPGSPKSGKKGGKKEERKTSPSGKNKKGRSPSPKKDEKAAGKKASRSPSPKGKGSRSNSRSGSRSGSRGRRSPVKEPEPEAPKEPEGPPEPEPGSSEWEYVAEPLDDELAHILVKRWHSVEDTYIDTCKHVFRKIREERENIYRYMYRSRKNFAEYLQRPDTKQEFISLWQREFNEMAIDMRDDEDTKAELHQRLEDLCERLWNISDTRKEDAETERTQVMNEGWLEDHVGLLTNHYISLMQSEVSKFQDTCKVLRDYFIGMEGGLGPKKAKVLPDASDDFTRISLVELPANQPPGSEPESTPTEAKPLSAKASKDKEKETKTPDPEEDESHKRRIPLVPRRPKSADPSGTAREVKAKKSTPRRDKTTASDEKLESPTPPSDPDERLLFDALQAALLVIEAQAAADQAVEEAELQRHVEQEKEREKELLKSHSKDKRNKKDGGRRSKTKSGKRSPGKNPVPDSPVPVQNEENTDLQKEEEEKQKRQKLREKFSKEYKFAVLFESDTLKKRLENIHYQSLMVVQNLKAKASSSYEDMNDWLGMRYQQEMESIDSMTRLARLSIEKESRISENLMLEDKDLIIDYDLKRFKTPSPPPPPSPKEKSKPDTFTVAQLLSLHKQFAEIAPAGIISLKAFCDMIIDYASCTAGTEGLPDDWMNINSTQLQEIAGMLVTDDEYLDWRLFLLSAAKPWPPVSVSGLLETLGNFREIDDLKINRIGREDFNTVKMWFWDEENDPSSFADDGYNRMRELHYALFDLFADVIDDWKSIDYVDMLLYFGADWDPLEGFLRALSVITGIALPSKDEIDTFEKPITNDVEDAEVSREMPESLMTPIVLDDILKVFNHSKRFQGDTHRFSATSDPLDSLSEERLSGIYDELGGASDGVPIYLLFQHPVMRDCINMCKKFKLIDLQAVLKNNES